MMVLKILASMLREVRRWLNRHRHPELHGEVTQTPYWGGIKLPVLVTNAGQTPARDCRYCRRQRFRMDSGDAGASPTALTWYSTDAFDVPADGSGTRHIAFATTDPCPQVVLADMLDATPGGRFEAALVCRDRFATFYRFRFADGQDVGLDMWRARPLDKLLGREAPEWTNWVSLPRRIENREWSSRFR